MKKDAYYFPHFCNARNDQRIIKLRRVLGAEGYGFYFMLLEVLREQNDFTFPVAGLEDLSYEWHTSREKLVSVVRDFDLFVINEYSFFSEKLIEYLQPYLLRSKRASDASIKRWTNTNVLPEHSISNTNAMQMHPKNDANAYANKINIRKDIKEIKEKKESKGECIGEKRSRFSVPTPEMVISFFISEKNLTEIDAKYRASRFIDFYDSKNWYVGKNKMTNWKTAATRSLEWEDKRTSQTSGQKGHFGYNQVDDDYVINKVMNS